MIKMQITSGIPEQREVSTASEGKRISSGASTSGWKRNIC